MKNEARRLREMQRYGKADSPSHTAGTSRARPRESPSVAGCQESAPSFGGSKTRTTRPSTVIHVSCVCVRRVVVGIDIGGRVSPQSARCLGCRQIHSQPAGARSLRPIWAVSHRGLDEPTESCSLQMASRSSRICSA